MAFQKTSAGASPAALSVSRVGYYFRSLTCSIGDSGVRFYFHCLSGEKIKLSGAKSSHALTQTRMQLWGFLEIAEVWVWDLACKMLLMHSLSGYFYNWFYQIHLWPCRAQGVGRSTIEDCFLKPRIHVFILSHRTLVLCYMNSHKVNKLISESILIGNYSHSNSFVRPGVMQVLW